MKTIFIDIDGTLIFQTTDSLGLHSKTVLPGVFKKWSEWRKRGYRIILTTARRESQRRATEEQLTNLGLSWDSMIMGADGTRVLINNFSTNSTEPRAIAINLEKNKGLSEVDI